MAMELVSVSVSDIVSDYRIKSAGILNLPIYASLAEKINPMKANGINVRGTLDELLTQIDVVVDCTPKGIAAKNLDHYRTHLGSLPPYFLGFTTLNEPHTNLQLI